MLALLARNWWAVALRGISALLVAALLFVWPGRTLLALVLLFGAYTFIDGILTIISVFRPKEGQPHRWPLLAEGLLGLVAGVLTFVIPGVSARLIVILLSMWAISTGVSEISSAIRLRKEMTGEWLLALGGGVSVVFGVLLLLSSGASPATIVVLLAAYALIFGLLLLILAFRIRRAHAGTLTAESAPQL